MGDVFDHTRLHRTAKYFMDSGRAETPEAAIALLQGFGLSVVVSPSIADSIPEQIALLTLINTARRTFLGGIEVSGLPDVVLRIPLACSRTLKVAAVELGARVVTEPNPRLPTTLIGDPSSISATAPVWRLAWAGWRGGVVPERAGQLPSKGWTMPLAPALAAAVASAEVFAWHAGDHPMAGRRPAGLSLWGPGRDWLRDDATEVPLAYLPSRLWLIGLGNLGQAFAWLLACLPYAEPGKLELMLQDIDTLAESNDSTSLLSSLQVVGRKKTRFAAEWLEARGFTTAVEERRFGAWTHRAVHEPGVALCGVDNALARLALDKAGFDLVIEAGLGAGPQSFRSFSLHSFPSSVSPERIWSRYVGASDPDVSALPAYDTLRKRGMDACGLAQLASRTVGVPFVGLAASTLVIAELLRRLHGGPAIEVMSGSLICLEDTEAVTMETSPYAFGHIPVAS
jgi:hypothetical protein